LKPKKLAVKLMKLGFLQKKVKQEAEHAKLKAEKARREAEAAKREAENHKQNLLPKGPSPLSFVLALILGWFGVHNFQMGQTVRGVVKIVLFVNACIFFVCHV